VTSSGESRVLGIDLAWGEGSLTKVANETGMVAVDLSGRVLDAGWARGVDETVAWMIRWAAPHTVAMVDASLLVDNPGGQRACETEVGQRYGRWKVSANSTNLASPRLAGVTLLRQLEVAGWRYDDGRDGPAREGRVLHETYPYTAIVGSAELGYESVRPVYKRKPRHTRVGEFRPARAVACDGLLRAMDGLRRARPALDLRSHPVTARLVEEPSPLSDREYKHREDLLDAALCAWAGLLWLTGGFERCQVLGLAGAGAAQATIIAPARPEQRRPPVEVTGARPVASR
jgi:predicted RNase H-like nuclease